MDNNSPKYMISIASEILNLHPQTLRQYERLGLVVPCRVDGKNRLYSENDICEKCSHQKICLFH